MTKQLENYFIKLTTKEPNTSCTYTSDFMVEIYHERGWLYATFGGSFSEQQEFTTRLAKNLNTIQAYKIVRIEKDDNVRNKLTITLADLRKELKTGICHTIRTKETPARAKFPKAS
ncbi:MAG: hypothetical protein DRQ40_00465 [Gammaproteobacteria bacterium]|nr:MAG: hypothetical protein DRQ40_00465 [Gammaproteobacteria bacterium]